MSGNQNQDRIHDNEIKRTNSDFIKRGDEMRVTQDNFSHKGVIYPFPLTGWTQKQGALSTTMSQMPTLLQFQDNDRAAMEW